MAPTLGSPALRFCKRRFGNGFKRTRGSIQIRQVEAASSLSAELRQAPPRARGGPAPEAHGLGSRAQVPTLPRLPLVPDPLRRIDLPQDLEAVTTAGAEAEPEAAGIDADAVEEIWESARRPLPRRRPPGACALPAARRPRGDRPRDRPRTRQRPGRPATTPSRSRRPPRRRSASTRPRRRSRRWSFTCSTSGALSIDDRVADHIPEYARHGKGEITIGQVLVAPGRGRRACRATRSTSTGSTIASS